MLIYYYYLDILLSIMFDETEINNRTNQWLFFNSDFNKELIINPKNVTVSNTPEGKQYRICMTSTGLINGRDKSRYYVN